MWDIIDRKDEKTDAIKNRKEKRSEAKYYLCRFTFFKRWI